MPPSSLSPDLLDLFVPDAVCLAVVDSGHLEPTSTSLQFPVSPSSISPFSSAPVTVGRHHAALEPPVLRAPDALTARFA